MRAHIHIHSLSLYFRLNWSLSITTLALSLTPHSLSHILSLTILSLTHSPFFLTHSPLSLSHDSLFLSHSPFSLFFSPFALTHHYLTFVTHHSLSLFLSHVTMFLLCFHLCNTPIPCLRNLQVLWVLLLLWELLGSLGCKVQSLHL
ncbi:hypothetical protein FKM82_000047 [Ascaphus truei]